MLLLYKPLLGSKSHDFPKNPIMKIHLIFLTIFPKEKITLSSITFVMSIQKLGDDKHAHCFIKDFSNITKSVERVLII
jgi:hypothetical protein